MRTLTIQELSSAAGGMCHNAGECPEIRRGIANTISSVVSLVSSLHCALVYGRFDCGDDTPQDLPVHLLAKGGCDDA